MMIDGWNQRAQAGSIDLATVALHCSSAFRGRRSKPRGDHTTYYRYTRTRAPPVGRSALCVRYVLPSHCRRRPTDDRLSITQMWCGRVMLSSDAAADYYERLRIHPTSPASGVSWPQYAKTILRLPGWLITVRLTTLRCSSCTRNEWRASTRSCYED